MSNLAEVAPLLDEADAHETMFEVRARIPDRLRERSNVRALGLVAFDVAAWVGTFVAIFWAPNWPLRIAAMIGNSVVIGALFVLGHEACHRYFSRSRRLDGVLGRLCLAFSLTPFTEWHRVHNVMHHGYTNLASHDPAWRPWSVADYRAASPFRRWLYRLQRGVSGFGAYWTLEIWWPMLRAPLGRRIAIFDRVLVGAAAALLVFASLWLDAVLHAPGERLGSMTAVVCGVVAPFLIANWHIGAVTFIQHNHPDVRWSATRKDWDASRAFIEGTVQSQLAFRLDLLLHGVTYHTVHHIDVTVPIYRLREAHEVLVARNKHVICEHTTFRRLYELTKQCQLYDFRRHRWVTFAEAERRARLVALP